MKVPEPRFTVGKSSQPASYIRAQAPDLSPIARGLQSLGNDLYAGFEKQRIAAERLAEENKQKAEKIDRYKATASLVDFETQSKLKLHEFKQNAQPDDANFADRAVTSYLNWESEYIANLPPDLQEEFKMRVASTRANVTIDAYDFQDKQLNQFYKNDLEGKAKTAVGEISQDDASLEGWKERLDRLIDESDLSATEKFYYKQENAKLLEGAAYKTAVRKTRLQDAQYADELGLAVRSAAKDLGIDPVDLMTVISYETGGKLSTGTRGGAGNRHIGLIQFGPNEQKEFGAYEGQPVGEQMAAVVRYLKARGLKPGMSFADLYSTINAGRPGKYGASDAANGGMPGSVLDKVNSAEMAQHRAKALQIFDGKYTIPDDIDSDPRYSNVTYEDRIAFRKDMNTEVNAIVSQLADERKAQRTNFLNGLYNGLLDGSAGRAEYEAAIEAGLLDDYDDRNKALGIIEKREKELGETALFRKRLEQGRILDPTDNDNKKGMNLLFTETDGEAKLNARDQQYVNETLVPYFDKTTMMPPDAVSLLGQMGASNDGREILFANEALSILEDRNPTAYARQVPEAVAQRADLWELMRNVVPENELIDILREAPTQEMRNVRIARKEEIKKELVGSKPPFTFDEVINEFDATLPPGFKSDAMAMEAQSLFIENYSRAGSVDVAKEMTLKQLKRYWGVTSVGASTGLLGTEQILMRNPPEHFYPQVGKSHQWMRRQMYGELGLADNDQVQLISDRQTEADIKAGKPPSYMVMVNKDGAWMPLRNPETGGYKRQWFEVTKAETRIDDAQTALENKTNQLLYWQLKENGLNNVQSPPEVKETIKQLEQEVTDLEKLVGERAFDAQAQYETPAGKRVMELEKKEDELQRDLYSFTGPLEEYPRLEEYGKVLDELKAAKEEARKELEAKRKTQGTQEDAGN